MLYVLFAGFSLAFISPFLVKIFKKNTGFVLCAYAVSVFGYFITLLSKISESKALNEDYLWIPQLSVNLNFYIDGLSLFFVLLISGFGSLIILYASSYLKGHKQLGRFYFYLLLFMNSMLGLVLAGNLLTLFVFWELTSLSSYLLISFDHENGVSRASALQAMFVTVGGGLVMMAGFILMGVSTGTFLLPEILLKQELLTSSQFYPAIVVLVLIGAFTKSAQFPFHFWLPNAMAAPTPVSAYLHSATMVKAGVYLVARLNPALGGTPLWETILIVTGSITMFMGAVMAIKYTDLKKILAYTTISALGMLFLMLGIGTPHAVQAAIIFILAHALYKGTLFLMTGNLDHQTGSRDIAELSGLRKKMPYTAFAAVFACFSMSGVIPFIGFIGKELIYEAVLHATFYNILLLVVVVLSSVIFTALAIDIGYGIFFGSFKSPQQQIKEAYKPMLVGPLLISVFGLLFGLFPETFIQPLLNISALQVLKDVEILKISIWHGFNLVLLLSLLTLLIGFILYRFRFTVRKVALKVVFIESYGPAAIYEKVLSMLLVFSHKLTRITQSGYLRYYILIILSAFIMLVGYVLFQKSLVLDISQQLASLLDFRTYEVIICIFIIAGVILVIITGSRLTALASMGVVGYGIAVIFILFSAPDAAMTQFLVETLTVVLFVLVLHKLPLFKSYMGKARQGIYLVFSIIFGAFMTYLLLLVTSYPLESELKNYFGENSYTLGHGRNIVNVILVDFRALDTLGESVVLAIAAIGIFTLLKLRLDKEEQQ